MKELAEYSTDEKEKAMLLSMATTTPEGKESSRKPSSSDTVLICKVLNDHMGSVAATEHDHLIPEKSLA